MDVRGERLVLLPERAVYWPRRKALLVADTHWGKAAAFRAASVAVPAGTTEDDLGRLDRALRRTGARRLLVLGDLLHARTGRAPATLDAVARWRERNRRLRITLVRGNHDVRAGDPPPEWDFEVVDEPHDLAPFRLRHHPAEKGSEYVLAGHLHPAVRLYGPGDMVERLPCFRFGRAEALLPAFGSFTGTALIHPRPGDRIFVLADGEVIAVT